MSFGLFLFLMNVTLMSGLLAPAQTPEREIKTCDTALEHAYDTLNKTILDETKMQHDLVAKLKSPSMTEAERAAGLDTFRASAAHVKQLLKEFRATYPNDEDCALSTNPSEILNPRNADQSIKVVEEFERSL